MWTSTAVPMVLREENPALRPELGDRAGIAAARGNLGRLTTAQGGYAQAMVLCEEDLASERDLEDRHDAGRPWSCPLPPTLFDVGQRCVRGGVGRTVDVGMQPVGPLTVGAAHLSRIT
jgi:hypothetical protein